MAQASFNHKAANLWTSRIIPVILVGIVGYASWVVIVRLCGEQRHPPEIISADQPVNYLLNPPEDLHNPRHGAAVAILVLYVILLLLMGLTYFRLLYIVTADPGYVPRGTGLIARRSKRRKTQGRRRKSHGHTEEELATEKTGNLVASRGSDGIYAGNAPAGGASPAPRPTDSAPGLQHFYTKDVFVCQGDGRPIWCSTCENWKPDRAHHCREIERCVRKMDHFCPWVGGVVSETSFKFFIQFLAWTAVYCIFNLIVMAYFIAEYRKQTQSFDPHWLATVCLGALFGLFTMGMTGSSLQFAILNTTTIENLSRKNVVWTLAIYMPKPPEVAPGFRTISYANAQRLPGLSNADQEDHSDAIRTFAIRHTKPGENPFDLGPFRNFKSVMGDHWYDWLFPIRYSPCCDHDRQEGQFAMGSVIKRMRKEAGIAAPDHADDEKSYRRHRRRRRRHRRERDGASCAKSEKVRVHRKYRSTDAGHGRYDVDLESGLGRTNDIVH